MDLKVGVEALRGSSTFAAVLSVLLGVGNYLNGSQCKGFQLEYLDASRNRIKSLGVLSLLPSLKTILIQDNRISDIGHNTFLNKNNLTLVNLSSNQLSILSIASLTVSKALKNGEP